VDYSPSAFSLGARDVVAGWVVCGLVAAAAVIGPTLATAPDVPTIAAQGLPVASCGDRGAAAAAHG
jgi:hypothetical protein